MSRYKQSPHKPLANGYCVGIMDFPWRVPYIPGDVTNASTYDYPVLFKTYTDVDLTKVACGDQSEAGNVIKAVQDMNQQGVKGISGDCGFLLNYLDKATEHADVPLFMSSLQLLPLAAQTIGKDQAIAILTPCPEQMTPALLSKAGFNGEREIIPLGLQDCEEFNNKLMQESDSVDSDKVEAEMVVLTTNALQKNPQIGAFLLECSMLPPYAKAIREATGRPVLDFISMIDLFQSATHRKHFDGYY